MRLDLDLSLEACAAITVTDVEEGPENLYPDPDIEDATGYSFFGDASHTGTSLLWNDADQSHNSTITITGDLLTALNAALADSTPHIVTLSIENFAAAGILQMRLKQGVFANFNISANGDVPATVTTGVGTIASFRHPFELNPICEIAAINIVPA